MRGQLLGMVAVAALAVGLAPLPAAQAATPTCFGKKATIIGTNKSETINGTAHADVIVGRGGNDIINGGGGNDWICDPSSFGDGNTLRGGPGDDHLYGAYGLFGGDGNDVLIVGGTLGSTVAVNGGPGNDILRAPVLKATFVPGPGTDRVVGKKGVDNVDYVRSGHAMIIDLAAGTAYGQGPDTLVNVDIVYGSAFGDLIRGDGDANQLYGAGGNDRLFGLGGNDFLAGWAGADREDGGAGTDTCENGTGDTLFSCEAHS